MLKKLKKISSILVVLFILTGIILINSNIIDDVQKNNNQSLSVGSYSNYINIKTEEYLKVISKLEKNKLFKEEYIKQASNLINSSIQYSELLFVTEALLNNKTLNQDSIKETSGTGENSLIVADNTAQETVAGDVPEEIRDALEEEKNAESTKRVLLEYKDSSEAMQILKNNISLLNETQAQLIDQNLLSISVPEGMTVEEVIDYFEVRDDINKVEEDYEVNLCLIPNDTYYNSYQWNLKAINADLGWEIAGGGSSNITVAVLDTGIAYEDYSPYVRARDFKSDTFVSGFDFINNDDHPNDDHGHGTHVAGTIAQNTNNGFGCAGIASDVKIMPLKVMNSSGSGNYSGIIAAIYYAVDHGADVINMSLGGGEYLSSVRDAIVYAKNNNVVVVCASGNNNSSVIYPAAYPESIAVGSINAKKNKSSFSCYGDALDVVAPGESILQETIAGGGNYNTSFYQYSGTSMAAPHVAALAALIQSIHPGLSSSEVEEIIKGGCEDRGEPGYDVYYGHGLINIYNSVIDDTTAPIITKFNISDDIIGTDTRFVDLNIEAYDLITPSSPVNYMMQMRFKNDDSQEWSAWEDYSNTKSWVLGDGEGTKEVFIELRDNKLNQASSSDTIEYTGPEIPLISAINPNPASGIASSQYNTLTIDGSGFGIKSTSQDKYLTFSNNIKVYSYDTKLITSWTDNQIIAKVPQKALTGQVSVTTKGGITSADILIDSVAPVISLFSINENASITNSNEVFLSIAASDLATGCSYMSFKTGTGNWSELEEYHPSRQYLLSEPMGAKTVYVRVYDAAGNYSEKSDSINFYPLPEVLSITPDPASGSSASPSNVIIITGTSFGSSRKSTSFVTFSGGFKVSSKDKKKILTWSNTQIKVKVPSNAITGDVSVTNFAGTSIPCSIVIDSLPPLVDSVTIDGDAASTTSGTVTLDISARDNETGLKSMQFANSSKGPWSALEDYNSLKSGWTLSVGPGKKTVYVKIFDNAGNYTIKSDTINLAPEITQVSVKSFATTNTSTKTNTIIISGLSFGSSRVSSSYIYLSNGIKIFSTDKKKVLSWSDTKIEAKIPAGFVNGTITVINKINRSEPYNFLIDNVGPDILSFTINDGDSITDSTEVTLKLEANDDVSQQSLLNVRFKNESDTAFSEWESYASTKQWHLSGETGPKTVTVEIMDEAGNSSASDAFITVQMITPENTEDMTGGGQGTDQEQDAENYVSEILNLINDAREDNDLNTLTVENELSEIAGDLSLDMLERDYFSEITPEEKDIFDILDDNEVQYLEAGKNIVLLSYPFDEIAETTLNAWIENDETEDNVLSGNFSKVGIGISTDSEKIIVVVIFTD